MAEEEVGITAKVEETEELKDELLFIKKCDHCERFFNSQRSLRSHIKVHKEKVLECRFCDEKFNRTDLLFTHLIVHVYSGMTSFECPIGGCDFKSDKPEEAERHLVLLHSLEDMKCDECSAEFGNHRKLYTHKILSHGELKDYWEQILKIKKPHKLENGRKRRLEEECQDEPPVLEKMEERNKIPETIGILKNVITPANGETPSQMLVKISDYLSTLFPHETEEFSYKCSFCSIAFSDAILWMTHLGFHDQEDPLKCATCNKKYENRQAFVIHLTYFAHGPTPP